MEKKFQVLQFKENGLLYKAKINFAIQRKETEK
jgi:hypothetical protein